MKHAKKCNRLTSKSRVKLIALVISLSVLLLVTAGGVLAYLAVSTDPIPNTFISTEVSCSLITTKTNESSLSYDALTNVQVENTGTIDGYVRVRLIPTWVDASGKVQGVKGWTPVVTLNSTDWIEHSDGFYYYKKPLAPAAITSNMLSANIIMNGDDRQEDFADNDFRQKLDVYVDIIQSTPTSAVQEAWGVNPTTW